MTRTALILIFACILSGALFAMWKTGLDSQAQGLADGLKRHLADSVSREALEKEREMARGKKGTMVHLTRDVEKGAIITSDCIVQVPDAQDADSWWVQKSSEALGRRAGYRLINGHVLSRYELAPPPPGFVQAVSAAHVITQGAVIDDKAVEEVVYPGSRMPSDGLTKSAMAVGKKAKYPIVDGQILRARDVEP